MEKTTKNKAYVRPFLAESGCRQMKTIRIIDALECSNSSLNSNDLKTLVFSCSIFRSFLQSKPMPPPVPLDLMAWYGQNTYPVGLMSRIMNSEHSLALSQVSAKAKRSILLSTKLSLIWRDLLLIDLAFRRQKLSSFADG